jgi:hypothetical protein
VIVKAAVEAPTAEYLRAALQAGVSKKAATDSVLAWAGRAPGRTAHERRKTEDLLEVILQSGPLVEAGDEAARSWMRDAMAWAIGAASPKVVELLLDLDVNPNDACESGDAVEEVVRHTCHPDDAKELVRLLLGRGAVLDKDWVTQVAKRQKRGDWLEVEP